MGTIRPANRTPKNGKHSVGVARQHCGELGKQDNFQVAVTLSVASDHASLLIALRLYLHETWANDSARREKAGVPDDIEFQTRPKIALDQIARAIADGVPKGIALADAGYGNDTAFRAGLTQLGLDYIVGVQGSTTKGELTSRFAALRVRPSHRDTLRSEPHAEEWLLIEWSQGEKEPTKYWLSTLEHDAPIAVLVDTAKLRWRIERDFQDLKQEIGLDHYEGRGWRGFNHHAALSIAAYHVVCDYVTDHIDVLDTVRPGQLRGVAPAGLAAVGAVWLAASEAPAGASMRLAPTDCTS